MISQDLTRNQRLDDFEFFIACTYYNEYSEYDFDEGLQSRNWNGG